MTPQLIPVSETYEALVAGVKKTASTFENLTTVTAYVLGVYSA